MDDLSAAAIAAWAALGLVVAIALTVGVSRSSDLRGARLATVFALSWIMAPLLVAGGVLLLAGVAVERLLRPVLGGK